MKITGLKIRAVNIPLIKPYTVSLLGKVTTTRSVIVEVFTDQGLVGIGETDPELMFTGESQQTVMTMLASHLGPAVLDIDPLDLEDLHERMNAVCVGNHFAKAALDLACHDIWCKYHHAPLYQLFGGMVHPKI
jgi:L-alanine-DL-glutamate epimerase-like enolase superfamily enzyme